MVKIQDPTVAYSTAVSRRRRSRAAADGEQFRLVRHGRHGIAVERSTDRRVVIGASAWALKDDEVEQTVGIIGLVGGLLADMGFRVCPIGADAGRAIPPSIVVWVCGDETRADEYEQLAAIGVPGLAIGSCVDGLDEWAFLESDRLEHREEFIRQFVDEITGLS